MSSSIPHASGIYRITCTVTGKFYVGSALNLYARWMKHRSQLRRSEHRNARLQAAWNKYGEDSFVFEILEMVLIPDLLTAREQYWLDKLKPIFNIAPVAGSSLGRKHTLEEIEKIRQASTGRKHTPESRAKMSKVQKGHPTSQAARDKIGLAGRGRPSPNRGRKFTPEELERHRLNRLHLMKTVIAIAPDGAEHPIVGVKAFCKEHGLNCTLLMRVANGKVKHHKGWKARYP